MCFVSILDLLLWSAQSRSLTESEMYAFFKARRISKARLKSLAGCAFMPTDKDFIQAAMDFTGLSVLEMELLLGRVPLAARQACIDNIKEIANLVSAPASSPICAKAYRPFFETESGFSTADFFHLN